MAGADRRRPDWWTLPEPLRAGILEVIGGSFVTDAPAHGGFGAGYAGVVTTSERRAFVKACAIDGHADSLLLLRQEIDIVALLPATIAPSILGTSDGAPGAALVVETIDGHHPGDPWTRDDLHAMAVVLAELATTPAPSSFPDAAVSDFRHWEDIAADAELREGLPSALRTRMPELFGLEQIFGDAVSGDMIAHNDVRADNVLIDRGRAHLIDWPHARRGAPWIDLPGLLPSIEASGGPRCEEAWAVFEEHGAPSADALLPVIAGFASFFWHVQAQPEIPELPGLRAFQRAQAIPALRWLSALL